MATATERVSYRKLWWVGLLALVASLAANAVIRAAALAVLDVAPEFNPLQTPSFALLTTVGVIAAVVVYAIIGRMSRRPIRTFHVVALAALVLSFLPDIGLLVSGVPGANLPNVLVLMLQHVVTYLITVLLLTRLAVE